MMGSWFYNLCNMGYDPSTTNLIRTSFSKKRESPFAFVVLDYDHPMARFKELTSIVVYEHQILMTGSTNGPPPWGAKETEKLFPIVSLKTTYKISKL